MHVLLKFSSTSLFMCFETLGPLILYFGITINKVHINQFYFASPES